jgi:hypothetical protein
MLHQHRIPHGLINDLFRQTRAPGFLESIRYGYVHPAINDLRDELSNVDARTLIPWDSTDRTLPSATVKRLPKGSS